MTPGQEALIEAMRVEQARIYGATLKSEQAAAVTDQARRDEADRIGQLYRDGHSLAKIAVRLGVSKDHVDNVLRRAS